MTTKDLQIVARDLGCGVERSVIRVGRDVVRLIAPAGMVWRRGGARDVRFYPQAERLDGRERVDFFRWAREGLRKEQIT